MPFSTSITLETARGGDDCVGTGSLLRPPRFSLERPLSVSGGSYLGGQTCIGQSNRYQKQAL